MNQLRRASLNNYKKSPLANWVIGVLCGLFIAAMSALGFFANWLMFIIVPFVIFPFIYACHLMVLSFKHNQSLTLRNHFKYMSIYYKQMTIMGPFSILSSLFKTILIEIIATYLFSLLSYSLVRILYPDQMAELANVLEFLMENPSIIFSESSKVLFANCYDSFKLITYMSSVPGILISFIFFLYFTTRSSIILYATGSNINANPRIIKVAYKQLIKEERWNLFKDYLSLNWPMIAMYFLSAIGFFILGLFIELRFMNVIPLFAITTFFILMMFFFPFYFSNMEELYNNIRGGISRRTSDIMMILRQNQKENNDEY